MFAQRQAPDQVGGQLAVLGDQPVELGVEGHGRPDDGGLLAEDRREDAEFPLPLECGRLGVEGATQEHPAQAFQHELVVERRLGAGPQLARGLEDLVDAVL